MASVPALAPPTPPLIGASMTVTSAAAHSVSTSRMNATPTVQVLTSVFKAFPASKPSGPESALRKISSVGNETITVSHVSANSFGDVARRAERSRSGSIASLRTS
jgi:hypothetical protein